MDEFWIEPLTVDGYRATLHACFNEFSLTIIIERKDGGSITESAALGAYNAVALRLPPTIAGR